MRILMAASLALAASVGAVFAQTTPSSPPSASASPRTAATPPKPLSPAEVALAAKTTAEQNIADCMRLWDKGTHMSKQQWSSTCKRIQTRLENLKVENLDVMGTGVRKKSGNGRQGSINSSSRMN
jgi:predicted pyridoxine 5'-phosphate oxidase superfamily flavin-nucleotide-binding protein